MKFRSLSSLFVIGSLVLLQGCQSASTPSVSEPGTGANASKDATKEELSGKLKIAKEKFQGNGLNYSGLLYELPLTYLVTQTGEKPEEGVSTTTFLSEEKDVWKFSRTRTGSLIRIMGDDKVEVNAKGIFVTEISMGKLEQPMMELPNNLAVGTTWDVTSVVDGEGGTKVKQVSKYKVTKEESMTTKAGTFNCLVIEATSDGSTKDKKVTAKSTFWYAEPFGAVKMVTELTQMESLKQVFSVELVKIK